MEIRCISTRWIAMDKIRDLSFTVAAMEAYLWRFEETSIIFT